MRFALRSLVVVVLVAWSSGCSEEPAKPEVKPATPAPAATKPAGKKVPKPPATDAPKKAMQTGPISD